ncbi:MAG: methyltransferase domain-containing protein [Micromonosporaceae bacterium]
MVQLLLLAGLVWLPGARVWSVPAWLAVLAAAMMAVAAVVAVASALRLGTGLTASPLPSPAARLRTTGMYACVRHPIYTALLVGGAGVVLLGGRLARVWVWFALLTVLLVKTLLEEAALRARFPGYAGYAAATPRLVPRPLRCAWSGRVSTDRLADRGTDMDSASWDARYQAVDLVWGGEPNRFVSAEFAAQPPGRALDLGAGEGRNAIWLAGLGWRVTAVDFSGVAIERGRRMAEARGLTVDWVVADLRDYMPEPGGFDAVIVAYLHLAPAELRPVLHRAAAALAEGGRILVAGHDVTNLEDGVGGPQVPDILYTPDGIVAELTGLEIRRSERVRRPVATADGTADAIDTLVSAVRI